MTQLVVAVMAQAVNVRSKGKLLIQREYTRSRTVTQKTIIMRKLAEISALFSLASCWLVPIQMYWFLHVDGLSRRRLDDIQSTRATVIAVIGHCSNGSHGVKC